MGGDICNKYNYHQIGQNSHFWSDLEQLVNLMIFDTPIKEYLLIGLKNTIENGYEIQVVDEYKVCDITTIFTSIHDMINFINHEYDSRTFFLMLNYTVNFGYNLVKNG